MIFTEESVKAAAAVLLLIILIMWMVLLTLKIRRGGRFRTLVMDTVLFVFGLVFLTILTDSIPEYGTPLPLPAACAVTVLLCVPLIISYLREEKKTSEMLNAFSIKEAIDDLPDGAAFFDTNGVPVLCNHVMYRLAHIICGGSLKSLKSLEEACRKPAAGSGVKRISPKRMTFLFPDDTAWYFSREDISCRDGRKYVQITASNVTELYEKKQELLAVNEELADVSKRMRSMVRNVTAIAREEEILAMKMRVHDEIGSSVLATRRLLVQQRPMEEAESVIAMWRKSVGLLCRDSEIKEESSQLLQLTEQAREIGLAIHLNGRMPEDREASYILTAALRECATNAVRHAEASGLYADLSRKDSMVTIVITNDGKVPENSILEGGGLSSLRRRVERAGGTMRIQSMPVFSLTVSLPAGEDDE